MSKFQIVLLVIFGAFILLAVILFSRNRGSSVAKVNLNVWGSLSVYDFNNLLTSTGIANDESLTMTYEEKSADKLSSDFTEALAVGKGPDLIIIPVSNLLKDKDKLTIIPPLSVRPADYSSTFIKEGDLFVTALGVFALPMYVDPMVMYWNRDLLAKSSLAAPPVYWDQIYEYISKLTVKDGAGNITQTAMALGEARNIPHVKEILSLLMLQAGTPITAYSGVAVRSVMLENAVGGLQSPAISALEFYTQFANPQKSFYSWNRSQTNADTHFTGGKSAMYLGFASELPVLKAKNPTMDIGIAPVPQSRVSNKVMTFGRLYGVAIVRSTKDPASALAGALKLVSKESAKALSAVNPLIPARRDLLSDKPTDSAGFVFFGAALQSAGWLDPDSTKTAKIFSDMVESVTSGRARLEEAVGSANTSLNSLLTQTK